MNKQELIEKYKTRYSEEPKDWRFPSVNASRQALFSNFINDLEQLDEPKKVVVPPIIDKFIRENKDPIYEICAWSDHYGSDGRTCEDSKLSAVINWYGKNSNEFYRAVINGYEVKEEPLYYVELPEIGYLNNEDGGIKHTEQEIKAIDERYWLYFTKKVGDE
ncbi:DUF1642 domain-containing protein [Enterococcus faecalis]|uniref:DUF1642 domain-containing protein n=1 Tax=Enterococcus faecalis TaxID=1351 RepID=UPI002A76233A|nr:DUF1642 domain-containing protein [Enterococcus faecalis]MDY2554984.1 DUF1642 domain-containing protein [Enterococcus faecalis]